MKIDHPVLFVSVYLGIGFLLSQSGLETGTYVLVDLVSGLIVYAFISSLLSRR